MKEEEKTNLTQPLETPRKSNPFKTPQRENLCQLKQELTTLNPKSQLQTNTNIAPGTSRQHEPKNDINSSNHNPEGKNNPNKLETAAKMNKLENSVNKILQLLSNIHNKPEPTSSDTTSMKTQNNKHHP